MKLDHVTAVVADPTAASLIARLLGMDPSGRASIPGMSIATFRLGDMELHLNAPTGPGPVEDHHKAHGASFHHIAFAVADMDVELPILRELGFETLSAPVETAPGLREVFLDPRGTGGLWIQLVERRADVSAEDLNSDSVGQLAQSADTRTHDATCTAQSPASRK